jgi:hypothetical protein
VTVSRAFGQRQQSIGVLLRSRVLWLWRLPTADRTRSRLYGCCAVFQRIKTDRRDSQKLAVQHRAGGLTAVWVPDEVHEAMRDLVRARLDAMMQLMRARPVAAALERDRTALQTR